MHEDILNKHLDLVLRANETTNITSIKNKDEGLVFHIQDSLLALPEVEKAPMGKLVDIGSGAGYPGIPLAVESGRETLLVDSVKKKAAILSSIIEELSLEKIKVYSGRIEELARSNPKEYAVATARALAQLSVVMELASPLLCLGGCLICFKARIADKEINHALSLEKKLGLQYASDRTMELQDRTRRIICFKKVANPSVPLPRRVGLAQKKPLDVSKVDCAAR